MSRVLVLAVVLAMSTTARAESPELGAALVVGSGSSDPNSAGHVGGTLTLAVWSGRIAGVLEAGKYDWDPKDLVWYGIGVRVGLTDQPVTGCMRRHWGSNTCGTTDRAGFRPWLGAGVLHEDWAWETYSDEHGTFSRRAAYGAIGFDLFSNWLSTQLSLYFRVQHGRLPAGMPSTEDMWEPPYDTSLVLGMGVAFGGH